MDGFRHGSCKVQSLFIRARLQSSFICQVTRCAPLPSLIPKQAKVTLYYIIQRHVYSRLKRLWAIGNKKFKRANSIACYCYLNKRKKTEGWTDIIWFNHFTLILHPNATSSQRCLWMQLKGMATKNKQYLDSAATYSRVNLASSLDLASNPRGDGIHYRVGFHQASLPLIPPNQIHRQDKHPTCPYNKSNLLNF